MRQDQSIDYGRRAVVFGSLAMLASASGFVWAAPAKKLRTSRFPIIDGLGGFGPDGLGPPSGFATVGDRLRPQPDFVAAVRTGDLTAVSQTVGPVGNGPERFEQSVAAIAAVDRLIEANADLLLKVRSVADIDDAVISARLGVIYNFQDTTALETDLARIGMFRGLGLRVMQLTYNRRNLVGDGCLEPANGGLSTFGRDAIHEMNAKRVLIDLSHAGQRTMADAIAESATPVAITHTGCRALVDLPRNTADAELKALADRGGVAGIFLMPFLRAAGQPQKEDLVRHLNHAVKVAGEDHVSVGSDNPIMGVPEDAEARRRQREFFADRFRRGIAAPGEAADVLGMVSGYNTADRFQTLAGDLARSGWPAARVEKILGGNLKRLFGDVWGD
jgi:membrane dipeptidase